MVRVNTEVLKKAVENHELPKTKIAVMADASATTLDSALEGDPSMNLSSLQRIADYLGLDIEVSYVERAKQPAEAIA